MTGYCVVTGLLTAIRLSARSPNKWWWDDLCAFLGTSAFVLQTVALWLRLGRYPRKQSCFSEPKICLIIILYSALVRNNAAMVDIIYLNVIFFYIEDWCVSF